MNLADYNYANKIVNYYSIDPKLSLKKLSELNAHLRNVFSDAIACNPIHPSDKIQLNNQLLAMQDPNYKFTKKNCGRKATAATKNILGNRTSSKELAKRISEFNTYRTTRFSRLPKELIYFILSKQKPLNQAELARILVNNRLFSPDLNGIDLSASVNWLSETKASINTIFNFGLPDADLDALIPNMRYLAIVDTTRIINEKKLKVIFGNAQNAESITILPQHLAYFKIKGKITDIQLQYGQVNQDTLEELKSYTNLKRLVLNTCILGQSAREILSEPLPFECKIENCIS